MKPFGQDKIRKNQKGFNMYADQAMVSIPLSEYDKLREENKKLRQGIKQKAAFKFSVSYDSDVFVLSNEELASAMKSYIESKDRDIQILRESLSKK